MKVAGTNHETGKSRGSFGLSNRQDGCNRCTTNPFVSLWWNLVRDRTQVKSQTLSQSWCNGIWV